MAKIKREQRTTTTIYKVNNKICANICLSIIRFWYNGIILIRNIYIYILIVTWFETPYVTRKRGTKNICPFIHSRNEDKSTKHVWTLRSSHSSASIKCTHKQNQPVIVIFFFYVGKRQRTTKCQKPQTENSIQ